MSCRRRSAVSVTGIVTVVGLASAKQTHSVNNLKALNGMKMG